MSPYQELIHAGAAIDRRKAHLHLKACPAPDAILPDYQADWMMKPFDGADDKRWWEVPYAYDPPLGGQGMRRDPGGRDAASHDTEAGRLAVQHQMRYLARTAICDPRALETR